MENRVRKIGSTLFFHSIDVNGTTTIRKSLVVGNPTGGAKEAGSINAEKIYVQGSELVSGTAVTYVILISTPNIQRKKEKLRTGVKTTGLNPVLVLSIALNL